MPCHQLVFSSSKLSAFALFVFYVYKMELETKRGKAGAKIEVVFARLCVCMCDSY